VVLVLVAAGLLMFSGFSLGRSSGIEAARHSDGLTPVKPPSIVQTATLGALGLVALAGALSLQGSGVRIPTPARLDELTGRAQGAFEEKAEKVLADERSRGT
jgi:hypothetical protein